MRNLPQQYNNRVILLIFKYTKIALMLCNHAQGWWEEQQHLEKSQPNIVSHLAQLYHTLKGSP